MNDLIRIATTELARFLTAKLPELSAESEWWQQQVVDRLSFQQQRMVQERGYKTLQQLDLAALLRVFDQNWHELSTVLSLPREGRTWVKELQTVRNKWAHLSAEAIPASEVYRDADTLGRLFAIIGASEGSLSTVETRKAAAVAAMARVSESTTRAPAARTNEPMPSKALAEIAPRKVDVPPPDSLFRVGDLVALRSNPATVFPVIEVIPGAGECRYRVFQNNAKATYYESQLQAPAGAVDERRTVTAHELQARLTSLQILSPSTANLFPYDRAVFSLCPISIGRC